MAVFHKLCRTAFYPRVHKIESLSVMGDESVIGHARNPALVSGKNANHDTLSIITDVSVLLRIMTLYSGGASAVKKPGHFEVRKSSSQVTRMHFFRQKSRPFVSCRPRNTGRQRHFTVKIKQKSGQIW